MASAAATSPAVTNRPGKSPSWARRSMALGLLGLAGIVGMEAWRVFLGANFHTVVPGRVYRGAQQSGDQIKALAARYGIRTLVNLRGCCDDTNWHREQCRAVQALGISQEDIVFSSGRLPAPQEVRRLVAVLDNGEYPLFMHCYRGADRTGLACAVYLLLKTDTPFVTARRQLGWRYGHLAVGRPAWLDDFFDLYQDWLKERGQEHAPDLFRRWLLDEYRSTGRDYRIEEFVCRSKNLRAGQPIGYRVQLRNTGSQTWQFKPGLTSGTQLGYSLFDERDRTVCSGKWGLLERQVAPGQAIDLDLVVPSVIRPGRYRLFVDMLDQENGWFFQTGSEPLEEELVFRE